MTTNRVFTEFSTMYDLHTRKNAMGLIGIHTPSMTAINRHFSGLMKQFKFVKIVGCDVVMACASALPADPLQIGETESDIAPQDMFNPILYRAVSNDAMSTLLSMLPVPQTSGGPDLNYIPDALGSSTVDDFSYYYGLLSDSSHWRKAMPQSGLMMTGLRPIVFAVNTTAGSQVDATLAETAVNPATGLAVDVSPKYIRGPAMPLPRIPTLRLITGADVRGAYDMSLSELPPVYCGALVLPPAKNNILYYRLNITWKLEFQELRSVTEADGWNENAAVGAALYGSDYVSQSKAMSATTDVIDGAGVEDVKLVYEKV